MIAIYGVIKFMEKPDLSLPLAIPRDNIVARPAGHNVPSFIQKHKSWIGTAFISESSLEDVCSSIARDSFRELFPDEDMERMVMTAIIETKDFVYDEVFSHGAQMGYYEYDFFKGKYLLVIKYFSPDTPKRIEETNTII